MATKTFNIRLGGSSLEAAQNYAETHGLSVPVAVKRLFEQAAASQLNLPITTFKVCDPASEAFQQALSRIQSLERTLDDSYEGISRAFPADEDEIEDWRRLRSDASESLAKVSRYVGQMVNLVGLHESSMSPSYLAKQIVQLDKQKLSREELENLVRLLAGRNFTTPGGNENAD